MASFQAASDAEPFEWCSLCNGSLEGGQQGGGAAGRTGKASGIACRHQGICQGHQHHGPAVGLHNAPLVRLFDIRAGLQLQQKGLPS